MREMTNMMKELKVLKDLKNCPFCGSIPVGESSEHGHFVYCECQQPAETKEEATNLWNSRVSFSDSEKITKARNALNGIISCSDVSLYGDDWVIKAMTHVKNLLETK